MTSRLATPHLPAGRVPRAARHLVQGCRGRSQTTGSRSHNLNFNSIPLIDLVIFHQCRLLEINDEYVNPTRLARASAAHYRRPQDSNVTGDGPGQGPPGGRSQEVSRFLLWFVYRIGDWVLGHEQVHGGCYTSFYYFSRLDG